MTSICLDVDTEASFVVQKSGLKKLLVELFSLLDTLCGRDDLHEKPIYCIESGSRVMHA